jgi:hypothetical protein
MLLCHPLKTLLKPYSLMKSIFYKKSRRVYYLCSVLMLCFSMFVITSHAQVSTGYTFASAGGTYTPITGTTFVTGTGWDDDTVTVVLPFTFTYNNIGFTKVSINTNGILSFNYFPDIYNVCGFQSTTPVVPFNTIAGYGTDLQGASASSNIQYTTVGSAPNREFVVQWTDVDHYNTAAHTNHLNFQIRLIESSNAIKLIWGTVTMTATWGANTCSDAVTESGSVGLMGNTTGDLNIRKITNGTNTWAASVAGATVADVCNLSPANVPASGLTYSWTPPPPSNMVYSSSTTVFLNNGQSDGRNSSNAILQVQVVTSGALNPFSVTSLSLSTTGSTNAATDIASAKVYYTGYNSTFSTANQFGSTALNPNGAFTVNGTANLYGGTNYFWVVYTVSSNATIGDLLKGCCTQIVGNGTMGTQVPTATCPAGSQVIADIGQWIPLTHPAPHGNGETLLLLSDGTVLAHTFTGGTLGYGTVFDKLTPDTTGGYVNGTWTSIAPMARERLAFSSAILKDGRVYCAGGEYGTDGTQAGYHGEVYNPVTNTWANITGTSTAYVFSDGNCKILENGNVLQAGYQNNSTGIKVFNPTTMAYTTGPSTLGNDNESAWIKLPDNTILYCTATTGSAPWHSQRYNPVTNTWIADADVPVRLYDQYGQECGPGWMLPNGKAFFVGGTGKTAIYTPSGSTAPGSWVAGPDVPNGRGMPDAPGVMMINGKIIIAVSAVPTASVEFASPTYYYEYDYVSNTYTQINAPGGGLSTNQISQNANMLQLPDGNVLYASDFDNTNQYYVYVPGGTAPQASWKPVVNSIAAVTCTTFVATGIRFNGISEGSAFGDEGENDTNYPIVRLTSSTGRVYYARSYNWNSTGVQRSAADTVYFEPGASVPSGTYLLSVIANGMASDAVSFNYNPPYLSSTLTPPAVCSNTLFTYHPTSADVNATFTWTRAAAVGISNPPISTPQTSDPSEILINTSAIPRTVVYKYTMTDGGCTVIQNVTLIVNPIHRLTVSPLAPIICRGDSVSLTASGGSSYLWNPGNSTNNPYWVSPAATTVYTLSGPNTYGCADTGTVTVTVNSADTSVAVSAITLTSNQAGAVYQWIDCGNGNAAISGQTSQSYTATANGSYAVIVTANGCTDTSACYIITSVGLPGLFANGSSMSIYPNPTSGNFEINFSSAKKASLRIEFLNAIGQTVFTDITSVMQGENKIAIADKNLSNGIYLLIVDSAEGRFMTKVVVQ